MLRNMFIELLWKSILFVFMTVFQQTFIPKVCEHMKLAVLFAISVRNDRKENYMSNVCESETE